MEDFEGLLASSFLFFGGCFATSPAFLPPANFIILTRFMQCVFLRHRSLFHRFFSITPKYRSAIIYVLQFENPCDIIKKNTIWRMNNVKNSDKHHNR